VIPNTNIGFPFFTHQTQQNFKRMWNKFLSEYLHLKEIDYLTIDHILGIIKYCEMHGLYFPYMLFYRTQGGRGSTKHRSVFGGHIVQKAFGLLIHVGKKFGFTEEACNALHIPDNDNTYIYSMNEWPIIAHLNWDKMFNVIAHSFPTYNNGKFSITDEMLKRFPDLKLDMDFDIIGEDFPAYDTGIIREDIEFLVKHKTMGFLFKFLLNDLTKSAVWVGTYRILGIFWKSGHPLTSNVGSDNHRNIQFNVRDYLISSGIPAIIHASTTLADDSIMAVSNITLSSMNDYLEPFGLSIKETDSFSFKRDRIVGFLKVLIGVLDPTNVIKYFGDPQSRYYGLAHSERAIEQDIKDPNNYKADVKGVYRITGEIELDSFISKLASFGKQGEFQVRKILELVKDTNLGRKAILAISGLSSKSGYELYREDVALGFNPSWMVGLQVLDLLTTDQPLQ
jgi:hypothetical protein